MKKINLSLLGILMSGFITLSAHAFDVVNASNTRVLVIGESTKNSACDSQPFNYQYYKKFIEGNINARDPGFVIDKYMYMTVVWVTAGDVFYSVISDVMACCLSPGSRLAIRGVCNYDKEKGLCANNPQLTGDCRPMSAR